MIPVNNKACLVRYLLAEFFVLMNQSSDTSIVYIMLQDKLFKRVAPRKTVSQLFDEIMGSKWLRQRVLNTLCYYVL